jgi:hypothetical protein
MNLGDQQVTSDKALNRREVEGQGGEHEDAEQRGIGPVGDPLYAIEAEDPEGRR